MNSILFRGSVTVCVTLECCYSPWSLLVREAQQFIDVLFRKQNILSISNEHLTVMEDTEVNDAH